ncbi:MAG TPA: transposase [bacterium]|nr:transposase [bacterium]HPP11298.1 transposase [bacterium]
MVKNKKKGTAIHNIRGHFYLYEIGSRWDKTLKRARKITKGYLGKITPTGLQEPGYKINRPTTCKEYGASWFLLEENKDVIERLKTYFPSRWKEIFVSSVCRLMYQSPLKHIEFHYQESWLSEVMPDASLSKNIVGKILEEIGRDRETIVEFLKGFICGNENILIDLTHVFSFSQDMMLTEKGYNNQWDFTPQVNLLFIFSLDQKLPLFYRVLPGNIRDVSSLKATIEESGIEDVIIIGDKGFHSEENIKLLERGRLKYIIPLKRNNQLIDYTLIKKGTKKAFKGYFRFQKKFIWYYRCGSKNFPVWVFLDENLRVEEEQDYLGRIETHPEEEYTINNFHKKSSSFGTISLLTNLKAVSAQKIFEYFKSRAEIEQMFDTFKNTLNADRSYMRSDYSLEGWMFINYLSLVYYHKVYRQLVKKELLSDYSVSDVLLYLSKYRKVKVSTHWLTLEVPKQTRNLIENLSLHIT